MLAGHLPYSQFRMFLVFPTVFPNSSDSFRAKEGPTLGHNSWISRSQMSWLELRLSSNVYSCLHKNANGQRKRITLWPRTAIKQQLLGRKQYKLPLNSAMRICMSAKNIICESFIIMFNTAKLLQSQVLAGNICMLSVPQNGCAKYYRNTTTSKKSLYSCQPIFPMLMIMTCLIFWTQRRNRGLPDINSAYSRPIFQTA